MQPIANYLGGFRVADTKENRRHLSRVDSFDEPYQLFEALDDGDLLVPFGVFTCQPPQMYFPVSYTLDLKPRNDEQVRVVSEALTLIDSETPHVVQAPTGFGKTFVGACLIAYAGQRTCIVVHKADLMSHWTSQLGKFLPGVKVDTWQGDKVPSPDAEVVVAMVQSVCKWGRYPKKLFHKFGFVLVDEVHRMGAPEFSKAMFQFPASLRVGLSATPERRDGRDDVIHAHIGKPLVVATAVTLPPTVYRVHSNFRLPYWNGKRCEPQIGKTTWVDKVLATDANRNAHICKLVYRLHELNRNTVVFCTTRKQLDLLATGLTAMGVPHDFYVGGRSTKQLEKAKRSPVVLATYKMGSEGTDAPWWDACILATPIANAKQAVGRVLREYPDKKTPVVVDIVDPGTVWGRYAMARLKTYQSIKAVVKGV